MDALLVVDMQEGILQGDRKHDLAAVVERIDRLAGRIRQRGGHVLFVQHDGDPGVWSNLIARHPVSFAREAEL